MLSLMERIGWNFHAVLAAILVTALAPQLTAQTYREIGNPGGQLGGSLAFDSNGNIYGTTLLQPLGSGSVYELSPQGNGVWKQALIDDNNLAFPSLGVTLDAQGNIFGADELGPPPYFYIQGSIFELSPKAGGGYSKKVAYQFPGFGGPAGPNGDLVRDSAGNFYGTTSGNGNSTGPDEVFELQNTSKGYQYIDLHSFCSDPDCADGEYPRDGLTSGPEGVFYGTTSSGGQYGEGLVFQVQKVSGQWNYTVLHSFDGDDGDEPNARVVLDAAGNLYGTTELGGEYGFGTVYQLTPDGALTLLHSFSSSEGNYPYGGLAIDSKGSLYGTTTFGGTNDAGNVFKLVPQAGGDWQEEILYNFPGKMKNGSGAFGNLAIDKAGNLYGNTWYGVVFEITPKL